MAIDHSSATYQNIVTLDELARVTPKESPERDVLIKDIERIVDSTHDKSTFLFGLRVLSRHGYPPDYLDKKVEIYNLSRAERNYQIGSYWAINQDGNDELRHIQ